jgi:polyisoprenoid-binding protein YceI
MNSSGWSEIMASPAPSGFRKPLKRGHERKILAIWVVSLAWTPAVIAQVHAIDTGRSVMTVRVYKAGLLSALGHDHEIAAPIAGGSVDATARQVEVHAHVAALQVRDPKISDKDSAEIQSTMLGPEVLDSGRFPEIVFRSTAAAPAGPGSWRVQGNLTLHGETHLVDVEVRETSGHYVGTARFKQSEFDIKPVKVAGGSIRVKDEVRIEFDIQLAR